MDPYIVVAMGNGTWAVVSTTGGFNTVAVCPSSTLAADVCNALNATVVP
jgi:hypothetical protein